MPDPARPTPPATLVISDTHLAHPSVRPGRRLAAEHLRPLWQGVDKLVVAGDLAELQLVSARAEASRQVARLAELCERDGVELDLLSGNHDAYLTDRRHAELLDGRVLVMHGDALHPAVAPWSARAGEMERATEEALRRDREQNAGTPTDLRRRLQVVQHVAHQQFLQGGHGAKAHGWTRVLRRPDRLAVMAWFWRNQADLASAFAESYCPHAEAIIFGHSHHPGVWQRAGRFVINTGSFVFPTRPRAVLIRGTTLSFHRIRRGRAGLCALQASPLWTRSLQTQPNQARRAA